MLNVYCISVFIYDANQIIKDFPYNNCINKYFNYTFSK